MNKTISANIGGLVFNLEEEGYARLQAYLDQLKTHFSKEKYGSEVVSDIENRIAEQFSKKIQGNTSRAITDGDVQEIIKSMGTVSDLTDEEPKASGQSTSGQTSKRLYRNTDDQIIAGVASGIAAYFGWDTTLVRVLFAITVLLGGWGIILYILLWIVMPEAKTTSEKLQMRGEPVTVAQLEQTVKEKAEQIRSSGALRNIGNGIAKVIKVFGKIILAVIGIGVIFGGTVAAFVTTFTGVAMLFNRNSPYMDPILSQSLQGSEYYSGIIFALVAALIPLILLVLAGLSLLMRKSMVNLRTGLILLFVWLAAAIGTGVVATKAAPRVEAAVRAYEAQLDTRILDIKDFSQIEAGSAFEINITKGAVYKAEMKGIADELDEVEAEVREGKLELSRNHEERFCIFCRRQRVELNITMPNLEALDLSGAVTATAKNFEPKNFNLDLSGASKANLGIKTDRFDMELSGASHVTLEGTAKTFVAEMSGASISESQGFEVDDANIKTSGASQIEITVNDNLEVRASGASNVDYYGNPSIKQMEDSGASEIIHKN